MPLRGPLAGLKARCRPIPNDGDSQEIAKQRRLHPHRADAVAVVAALNRRLPRSMGWQHKSLTDICMQLKDTSRNGGKTLYQIIEHAVRDSLVAWAWKPGAGREPAPGRQASFCA